VESSVVNDEHLVVDGSRFSDSLGRCFSGRIAAMSEGQRSKDVDGRWLALSLAWGLLALHAALFFDFRVDDAFILLRYADNLSHGQGLVFNAGERVEGFTSPALVVIQAGFMRLGLDALTATKILGVVSGFAIVATTFRLAELVTASRWTALAATVLAATQPSLATACVNGLETAPFAACLLYGLYRSLTAKSARDDLTVGAVLSLAFLLRPEGGLALLLAGVRLLWRERTTRRWSSLVAFLAPIGLIALPLFLWKASYFQAFVPNTFIAKVPVHTEGRLLSGLRYLLQGSPSQWPVVGALGLGVLAVMGSPSARALAGVAAVWTLYVVYTGGDWVPVRRFLVPIEPLLAIGLATGVAAGLRSLAGWWPVRAHFIRAVSVAGCLFWLLIGAAQATPDVMERVNRLTAGTATGREPLGRWLRQVAPRRSSVALLDVGAVAYFSELNVIDIGGLTDAPIARIIHESRGRYFGHLFFPSITDAREIVQETLRRAPEFVVLLLHGEFPREGEVPPRFGAFSQDHAFVGSPEFLRSFRYVCVFPEGRETYYNVFVRKDFTGELPSARLTDGLDHCKVSK
jgi:arabinofuranosyltransferase